MRHFILTLTMLVCALLLISTIAGYLEHASRSIAKSHDRGSVAAAPIKAFAQSRGDDSANEGDVTFPNGERYVGELRGGVRSGHGTYTWPDGRKYSGEFRAGQPDGYGTYSFANGEKYEGEFRSNRRTGQGTYGWPDGRKYVGQFADDQPHGRGAQTWADGRTFTGEFRRGQPNGRGILSYPDGRQRPTEFRDGEFVDEDADRASVVSSTEAYQAEASTEVQLHTHGVNYTIPALVNNSLALEFYFDSGAADVTIPGHVFETLKKEGSIRPEDILGTETYVMANGAPRRTIIIRIRSLKVGSTVVENVRGSVAENAAPLLLGMSFLSHFKSWSVDNRTQVLKLN